MPTTCCSYQQTSRCQTTSTTKRTCHHYQWNIVMCQHHVLHLLETKSKGMASVITWHKGLSLDAGLLSSYGHLGNWPSFWLLRVRTSPSLCALLHTSIKGMLRIFKWFLLLKGGNGHRKLNIKRMPLLENLKKNLNTVRSISLS